MPKTTKAPAKRRIPTPDDLHLRALLALIDGNDRDPDHFQEFIDAARSILNQSTPFDGSANSRSVHSFVTANNLERWSVDAEEAWDRRIAIAMRQLEARQKDSMKASAEDVGAIYDLSINDATYIGAALMFCLLTGGAR